MATYNGAKHIREQLDSLAQQTLAPLELVVTDDASTDETIRVIEEFALAAPFPVRVVRNEHRLGYGDNFLHAASLCRGSLIAFCDQDDVWVPEKLARCVGAFEDPDVMLCVHAAHVWDGTTVSDQLYPVLPGSAVFTPPSLDPFQLMPGFAMVVRADLLQLTPNSPRPTHMLSLGSKPKPQAHDDWMYFLAATTGKVATINEPLALYRQHSANVVGAPEADTMKRSLALSFSDFQYGAMANLEAEYSSIAESLSARLEAPRRDYALAAARSLHLRSTYHRLRASLYAPTSNIFERLTNFAQLLFRGAYQNDRSKTRLGHRAGLKDLCFGVPGFHKRKQKPAV